MSTDHADTPGKRRALGQGMSALLGGRPSPPPELPTQVIRHIALEYITPNQYQPRRSFNVDRLNELAASIRVNGVVQPVLLRPVPNGRFEIVAGERRWRAARIARLESIPAVVQEISNERLLEVALVENIQREDLNPIEMAQAFEQLVREFSLTHEDIAERTGKDRATITNFLRLLKLIPEVQTLVAEGKLGMGHARALVGLSPENQKALAHKIVTQGLSVRSVEKLVAKSQEPIPAEEPEAVDPNMRAAIQEMERVLGTRVRIVEGVEGRGHLIIEYYSADDLERIYNHLVK